MTPRDQFIDIGITLNVREWPGDLRPFVLLHGLSSNSRTWDALAGHLASAGHRVIAVDQRGHGLSDKPDEGYDFTTLTADLARLLQVTGLDHPLLIGQSWGGNVLLAFGARYPGLAAGLGFVDGGFIDLQSRPGATWETVSVDLKPPDLLGTPWATMKQRLEQAHPDWSEAGIEATLANFEILVDGTVRPWLTLERHMAILRALWEQRPVDLYPQVVAPVLVCVAKDDSNPEWMAVKSKQINALEERVGRYAIRWFEDTNHDIHVHRPAVLARVLLEALSSGIWRDL